MAVTIAQFRADFPEFADASVYPNGTVNYWLTLALKLLDPVRWSDLWDQGVELYTAHNVLLERQATKAVAKGGNPGETTGIISSKSVGSVSKSMDLGSVTMQGAGAWNLTVYGVRFNSLVQIVGMGGIQLGVGFDPGSGTLGLFPV